MTGSAHRRSRGQSMVELAILLPVLVLLFLGAWTASDLISDNNTAVQASQQGARYGAELGQGPTGATVLGVDTDIIDQMLPILNSQLTNAKVTEIDIYQPDTGVCSVSPSFSPSGGQLSRSTTCPPDNGAYNSGYGELIDEYQISGTTITPLTSQYLLTDRIQTHPNESELGVRVTIHYTSPTMAMFTQYDTQYSVVRLAPVE